MKFLRYMLMALLAAAFLPQLHAQSGAEKVKVKVRISGDDDAKAKLRPVGMLRSGPNHIMMMPGGYFDLRFLPVKIEFQQGDEVTRYSVRSTWSATTRVAPERSCT